MSLPRAPWRRPFERETDGRARRLLDLFNSYYGGLTCVCWTPDGKYVLTGGQDDLISIWSPWDSALVARCQGHQSWVSALAFDPWRCDDRNYRFGSVGEDGRLCLWDFGVGMLYRPKVREPAGRSANGDSPLSLLQNAARQRGSISAPWGGPQQADSGSPVSARMRSNSGPEADEDGDGISHPVEPRARIPMLPPVLVSPGPRWKRAPAPGVC